MFFLGGGEGGGRNEMKKGMGWDGMGCEGWDEMGWDVKVRDGMRWAIWNGWRER